MVHGANNCQLSRLIQNLPPELMERICKEYIVIKIKERAALGWDDVQQELLEAPFCENRERIVKLLLCLECGGFCGRDGLCASCYRDGVTHNVLPKYMDINDFVHFRTGIFIELAGNSRQVLDKAVLIPVAALAWSDVSYQVVKVAVDREFVFQIHRKPVRLEFLIVITPWGEFISACKVTPLSSKMETNLSPILSGV
ncbi:hypothetical protein OS493_022409 [Desmophyllum pertusum]|uniref:Uncharacterized protein n=1 Tax=Desmophyllum pertusum TaxID=174260 RepID=A0A9X0A0Q0_9CNID|nr:hypothetical protein OS493_022409 [Desmophyllum pertusum]